MSLVVVALSSCTSLPTEPQYGNNVPSNMSNPLPQTEVHHAVTQFLKIEETNWADRMPELNIARRNPKVLVVGWDGVRLDSLLVAETPTVDKVAKDGNLYAAYAGGDLGAETEQITVSGPGWATVLTGVWAQKHGFVENATPHKSPNTPSFLQKAVDEGYSAASSVTWHTINNNILQNELPLISHHENKSDQETLEAAISEIEQGTDVIFLSLDHPDIVGHTKGYYPEKRAYIASIEKADAMSGQLIEAIQKRETFAQEAWLVIFVTDHGGKIKNHGGQTPEERDIYLAISVLP